MNTLRWATVYATLLGFSLFTAGCLEKTIYPALQTTVVSVTPSELQPTNGTASLDLPTAEILLRPDTKVPSSLVSYHVTYTTPTGQVLDSLRLSEVPFDLVLSPESETAIIVRPYTPAVVTLYENSLSNIEPIRATIVLTIKDVNGNLTHPTARCLLYKPAS